MWLEILNVNFMQLILFKLRHNISIYLGETRNRTSEFERGEDRPQTASQAKDSTFQTNNTGMIHSDSNISVGKEPGLVKQISDITDNDHPQLSVISSKDTDINKSSSQGDFSNNTTTNGKPGVTSSTIQHKMEPSKHKKACTERIPSDDTNSVAVTTYSQKPSTGQGSALPEGKEAVLTSQQSNTISQSSSAQSTSAQSINATSNITMEQINDTTLREDSVIQSGSNATFNNTELKEINNSTSQPVLELHKEQGTTVPSESQSHNTQSKILVSEGKNTMLRGMTENILGSRSQEKRAPLLAVVKPSSTRTLTKNVAQQSVADSQPLSTPLNIFTSEAANMHADMINVTMSHNSNNIVEPRSQVLSSNQDHLQAPSQICTYTFTSTKAFPSHFTNVNTQLPKETPREGDQHSEHTSSVNKGLAKNTDQGISDQKSSQSVTEARVLRSRVTKTLDNNQPLSSRHPTTKMPVLDQSIKSPLRSNQSQKERKQESKSTNDEFCFSDGEDESIPQVIGSQVDRIEMFLKNERLRLSKKRKTTDE